MAYASVEFRNVSFVYDSSSTPAVEGLSVQFPMGWTGIIGANGAGKTTVLRLACGLLMPTRGQILSPQRVIYCPQRTDDPAERLGDFLGSTDSVACALRGQLRIAADFGQRWPTLSHGERKRAQIAVALWQQPEVLAIDEPTNHIDATARRLLAGAMRRFRGIGLLVSHDRELLDDLCHQCLFVQDGQAQLWTGGYTQATTLAQAQQQYLRKRREQARDELRRLQCEAAERAREAAMSHKRLSKSGVAPRDHDARARLNLARITGKDGQAGQRLRQLDGRLARTQGRLDAIRVQKERQLAMQIPGEQSPRDALLRLPAGQIELGAQRQLHFPDLLMRPEDRIALTGPNGTGKSTLVRHIVSQLHLPPGKLVYLAQEIDRQQAADVVRQVRHFSHDRLGQLMSLVGALGSSPQRLLETDEPSPGEVRKLLLALGLAHSPWLIIMDEPTNHLDLPSIACMEEALAECLCALLLVSHDEQFLQKLTQQRWQIAPDGPNTRVEIVGPA